MSDWRDRRQTHRRFAAGGSGPDQRDPRDTELDRFRDRIRDLEFENEYLRNQEQRRDDERTRTDSVVWDDYDHHDDFHNVFARQQRRQPSPQRPPIDPLRALGLRTEIPAFEGRLHADDFLDWLQTVDRVFDLRDIPEHLKVKIVAIRFRKYASLWWENVQKQRHREGKHKVETWEKMKRLLKNKFLPVNHKQDSFLDYHNLKQGSLTVEEFISAFEQHRLRCGIEEEDKQIIARFLGALRTDIADIVSLQQYWSFSDVCLLAHRVEKQLALKGKSTARFTSNQPVPALPNSVKPEPIKLPAPTPPVIPSSAQNQAQRCYKCHGLGHLKRECPNKQVIALIDEPKPVYDSEPDDVNPDTTHLILPDTGEALVIQRVLNTTVADPSDDALWLRNTIFRTKCTAKGKVCTVIIDGGSCENIVSSTMVEKAKHDGFRNTYSFKKDGIHITLTPCDPRKDPGHSTIVPKSVFTTLFKTETTQVIFGLLLAEPNPATAPIPPTVAPLIAEYADVFPNDIPAGLPMMQDIQHCIDFIPGASIPNKPAYRMNPTEFNELNRQVQELLEKGLIRESMSRCAVPALLVLKPNGTFRPSKVKPEARQMGETLQDFNFVIRHKAGTANSVADALSRRPLLVSTAQFHIREFDSFSALYPEDPDFHDVWRLTESGSYKSFVRHNGLLFHGSRICVPLSSFRESIVLEYHQGVLAGHFGRDKTVSLVKERF
ncbi:uncharacterized protein LOC110889155 [Helianthus annuus]|uniref:uncharacterized protein LOC110889155 n=1 Tax=Helianthus annuus TaxID=4232 RepID=UPI0016531FD7|nr:uncharacterized protein LOC110889155 [Helianthus annuus]